MDNAEERILGLEKTVMTLIGQIDALRRRLDKLEHPSKSVVVEMSPAGSLGRTHKSLSDLSTSGSPIPRHPGPYGGDAA